jgi:hypothetical protein
MSFGNLIGFEVITNVLGNLGNPGNPSEELHDGSPVREPVPVQHDEPVNRAHRARFTGSRT